MMTRRELIAEVNRQCVFSNKDGVEYIIRLIESVITEALMQGKTLKLNGFLKLGTKQLQPRKGNLKGKKWKTDKKVMAYVKVSPIIQRKIAQYRDEQANMDWLDRFTALSDEEQYNWVKLAQEQVNGTLE